MRDFLSNGIICVTYAFLIIILNKLCASSYLLTSKTPYIIIKELRMRRSMVKLSGINDVCDQNGDRVTKNDKSCHICSIDYQIQTIDTNLLSLISD